MTVTKQQIEALPPVQRKVFLFMRRYSTLNGYPPTVREIADEVGVASTFGVRKHLEQLGKKNFIRRAHFGLARAISIAGVTD